MLLIINIRKGSADMERGSFNKLLILFLMILCLGVGFGSICLMKTDNNHFLQIKEHLNSFFYGLEGISKNNVLKNSLYENITLAIVIFICGFFKPGIIVVALCIAKKGFVMGFTSASMLKCFGIKGLLINFTYLPSIIVALPMLMFFSSGSVNALKSNTNIDKKLLLYYILFAIITITIFCVASLLEAYLTTTFMKMIDVSL